MSQTEPKGKPFLSSAATVEEMSPFQPKEAKPGLTEALERVAETDHAAKAWEVHRRELIEERADAIRQALALGATLASVGELLGVTSVRVAQMRDGR